MPGSIFVDQRICRMCLRFAGEFGIWLIPVVKLGTRGKPVITGLDKRLTSEMVPPAGTFPGYLEFIRLAGLIAKYNAQ
jgi:hypothetical protein